tara:strand:- start:543 stop:1034 length:492 start_codon:yes stop_codon:yes gene_type:complete
MYRDKERKQDFWIATTRFNNETLQENRRCADNILHTEYKCIYGLIRKINTNKIPVYSLMYILEMNNERNEIAGIGLIRNYVYYDISIYNDDNLNQYIYKGKQHIDRDEIIESDNDGLLISIEDKVFKGKKHLKRGSGVTCMPHGRLSEDEVKFIVRLFSSTAT